MECTEIDHRQASLLIANKKGNGWDCHTLHSMEVTEIGYPWIPFALEDEGVLFLKGSSRLSIRRPWSAMEGTSKT